MATIQDIKDKVDDLLDIIINHSCIQYNGTEIEKIYEVRLYTMEGECCYEAEIPDSNSRHVSVYFVCSDEAVYVLSVNGIPLPAGGDGQGVCLR